jgi:hypothetical protein
VTAGRFVNARISGGSNDTEQNALTVMPCKRPSLSFVVTTVTPLGKRERAARNSSFEIAIV